jgi:hypothetical protein
MYDAHHVVFHPEKMSAYELQREQMKAMSKFYSFSSVLRTVVSPGFVTGAISYSSREIETFMYRKLRKLGGLRDVATYIPGKISEYISKTQFYGAVMRTYGSITARKSEKSIKRYITNVISKIKSPYKNPVSPGN